MNLCERYIIWGNVYFLGFMNFFPYDLVSHGCVEICCILVQYLVILAVVAFFLRVFTLVYLCDDVYQN